MAAVMDSFSRIADQADLVLVEGAGSPAEINLRAGDIANMGFATLAGVPVVLVGDIDRGGVIASIVGTHTILPGDDRAMIAGYLINKFRGDVSLFDDGISAIEGFTGWPCFGCRALAQGGKPAAGRGFGGARTAGQGSARRRSRSRCRCFRGSPISTISIRSEPSLRWIWCLSGLASACLRMPGW
jgi:hypothetical protein